MVDRRIKKGLFESKGCDSFVLGSVSAGRVFVEGEGGKHPPVMVIVAKINKLIAYV